MSFDCQVFVEICDTPQQSYRVVWSGECRGGGYADYYLQLCVQSEAIRRISDPLLGMHVPDWFDKLSLRYSVKLPLTKKPKRLGRRTGRQVGRFHAKMVALADPFSLLGRDLYIDRPAQGRLCRKARDKDGPPA
jgi:hypothetical protein